jgi:hypothetical protein
MFLIEKTFRCFILRSTVIIIFLRLCTLVKIWKLPFSPWNPENFFWNRSLEFPASNFAYFVFTILLPFNLNCFDTFQTITLTITTTIQIYIFTESYIKRKVLKSICWSRRQWPQWWFILPIFSSFCLSFYLFLFFSEFSCLSVQNFDDF